MFVVGDVHSYISHVPSRPEFYGLANSAAQQPEPVLRDLPTLVI